MGISKLNPSEGGIPYGNTAGRPANPGIGKLYSNGELQRIELYTGASYGWQNIVAETPGVTGYSGTVLETNLTNTITITGTNFSSGATATLVGTDGTEYNATSTTVNNLTSITATFNVISASKEPYDIKVTNPSNLYGVYYDVLTVNDKPAWTTAAGSLGLFNEGSSISVTVAATDEENNTITYSLAAGSSLPSGITLNSSTGVISGTLPDIASDTTYTFTINASDGLNTSQSRVFSITSTSLVDVDYLVIAGGGGGGSYGADVNGSNGAYQNGSSGSNSSISGSGITTITSIGGGYGGCYNGNEGGSGGSGGGAGGRGSTGTSAGGSGTSGQGFAGGNGIHDADKYPGGGGGGAGSAGASGTSSSYGNGGNGLASSITGSSVTRAGGGGAGGVAISLSTGLGGSGGGGNGGKSNVVHNSNAGAGGDGSINTGSGGGAGDYGYGAGHGGGGAGGYRTSYGTGNISGGNSPVENKLSLIKGTQYTITVGSGGNGGNYNKTYGRGGNGGSGIVILRSNIQASSTSGSPTYTNPSSGVYVYQFLNNGTITF